MLTITTIKSGIREKEEYYTQDESLEQQPLQQQNQPLNRNNKLTQAVWYGQGASELGLSGPIQQEDFKSVFYGFQPNADETIRRKNNRFGTERLGDDLTFSAPKSVSIALHVGNDLRIFDAHTDAVKEVLDEVEKRYAQTRISKKGNREIVNTNNLTVAMIPHHTSRDGDPQLHTHAFVMNGTKGPDGKWRSLYHEGMSHSQWLGSLYRQKLATKLQDIGYELRETKDSFELAGINKQQIQGFSKRSQQIIKSIQKRGLEVTPSNRDVATLTTRKSKQRTATLQAFQTQWKAESIKMGIKVPQAKTLNPSSYLGYGSSQEALDSAIANLEQKQVSFSREDIYRDSFSRIQRFDIAQLDQSINGHDKLLGIEDNFTTLTAIKNESNLRQQWDEGQHSVQPLSHNEMKEIENLNPGQTEALRQTLASEDAYQIVQGIRFKPFIGELVNQLKDSQIKVEVYSPTETGAVTLQKGYSIDADTVDNAGDSDNFGNHQLWVIDEAESLDLSQMRDLLKRANSEQARLVLVGGNNSDIKRGSPLRSLMDHGAKTHSLKEIIKESKTDIEQAACLINDGHRSDAVELLNNNGYVHEVEETALHEAHRFADLSEIASEYLALSPTEQAQTLIITDSDEDKDAIIQEIRSQMKASGQLGESVTVAQLIPKNLSKEQRQDISNYQEGDYFRLKRDYKKTPLIKDKLYQVLEVRENDLQVSSLGGRLYNFDPSEYKDIEVFGSSSVEIAIGDRIQATANDKTSGLSKKQFTVKAIDDGNMVLRDYKDNEQSISLSHPLPIERIDAGSETPKKATKVILASTRQSNSNPDSLLGKVSQFVKDVSLYVPDFSEFKSWLKSFEQSSQTTENESIGSVNNFVIDVAVSSESDYANVSQSMSNAQHSPTVTPQPQPSQPQDKPEQNQPLIGTIANHTQAQDKSVETNLNQSEISIDYQREYDKLASEIRSQSKNISAERLDLEVYLRANSGGKDGAKILSASDHQLNTNETYGQAIAQVADIYQRLSQSNTKNLELMTRKLVQQQFIQLNMNEDEKYQLSQTQVRQPKMRL
ncbi:putative TrwC/TraI protein [Crocosphaera subtropica ATCC 51142]|uniref:TrwC/TraI protein n=1 Tax=Crocosphaera subtropica (strain ATCC 51142 / BH68) TaxID=43989 RepID=B1X2J5_CROS5|nr:MobF family relaxase [Crocosphaera subtropica]ACB54356.1 putative TrwC/TraI protein [Crocosphaera subtropica ATCC 51142]